MTASDDLRAKAEAATPGVWRLIGDHIGVITGHGTFGVVDVRRYTRADATYIAAVSPDVVLALLARVDAAEAAVEQVRALLDAAEAHRGSYAFSLFMDDDEEQPQTALIGTRAVRAALEPLHATPSTEEST